MAQLRQDSMFQYSDAHLDCAEYVGTAPAASVRCFHLFHSAIFRCQTCGWNLCQFCKQSVQIVCVQCGLEGCEKCKTCLPGKKDPFCLLCHTLSYPTFSGWSGVCVGCRKEGKEVVKKTKVAAQPSSAAVSSASQATTSGVLPAPTFIFVPSTLCKTMDGVTYTKVAEPKLSALIRLYEQRRLEGALTGSRLAGYHGKLPPDGLQVVSVDEIHNQFLKTLFDARCALVQSINQTRPDDKQFKGTGIETVFHGTNAMFVNSIATGGFQVRCNKTTAYGNHAIYASKFPHVPEMHAVPGPTGLMHVFECEAIVGNNTTTRDLGSAPLATNYDSGGDGSGHIYAFFNNADLWPKYLYRLKAV